MDFTHVVKFGTKRDEKMLQKILMNNGISKYYPLQLGQNL